MNKFRILLLLSSVFAFNQWIQAQTPTLSLNSSNPQITWQVKPQADLNNITGEQISTSGFVMPDYVKGVVPGTVFTSYVEAGIVPDPNYADNIYQVDETFFNRPFWYRTEFKLPASYKGAGGGPERDRRAEGRAGGEPGPAGGAERAVGRRERGPCLLYTSRCV